MMGEGDRVLFEKKNVFLDLDVTIEPEQTIVHFFLQPKIQGLIRKLDKESIEFGFKLPYPFIKSIFIQYLQSSYKGVFRLIRISFCKSMEHELVG